MAGLKIQFPDPGLVNNEFTDSNGQRWVYNNVAWVRRGADPGIEDAPETGQQFARVKPFPDFTDPENPVHTDGYWELVSADIWYLGAHDVDPSTDNFGAPLAEGHTYYNTLSHTMFVWDTVEWDAFSGVSEIATLWEYRWDSLGAQNPGFILDALHSRDSSDPGYPGFVAPGDDHGNIPFDQWIQGLIVVSLYVNGVRKVEKRMLTPAYEDMPGRPSDEEHRLEYATWDAMPVVGQPLPVTYLTVDDGLTHYWDDLAVPPAYVDGGAELENGVYFYKVDYPNQEIEFLQGLNEGDLVVIETGTLAASQYIKSTYENAEDWSFVTHECDMGTNNPSKGLLPSQAAINCYVKEAILEAESRATNALIGSCFSFAGTVPPLNSLMCDGQSVSKEMYPTLFERIGTTWNNFNNAPNPDSNQFRLPPSEVNGFPLYMGGTHGANNVGDYLPSENKSHDHSTAHSHAGSVSSAIGAHKHRMYYKTYGTVKISRDIRDKTVMDSLLTRAEYDARGGSSNINNHYRDTFPASAGTAGSNVQISSSNAGTGLKGGPITRPPTSVMLTCIWVDIVVDGSEMGSPFFDINEPT